MALAYSIKEKNRAGRLKRRVAEITLDASYVAGGWVLSRGTLGFIRDISSMTVLKHDANGYYFELTRGTSPKLLAKQGVLVTGATAVAAAETGALATNPAGTELSTLRLPKSAVSTTIRAGRSAEAVDDDAFLDTKVITVEFLGW